MNSKYKIVKFRENKFENVDDFISIEEPLEISIKYKEHDKWIKNSLSITMRTPGHDEDLVRGFLFNEQIIQGLNDIETIESFGEKVGQYNIQNKILVTLNNSKNVNISKIKRDFLTNSKEVLINSPSMLRENQSEFAKTGGIHASGLFSSNGNLISLREDVGRHNALDKLIGNLLISKNLQPNDQFITCSGRLNFELVQKVLMTNIGLMIGVGAPTSLAIDLANKFDMTLVGFVKEDSFNIYTNKQKVIVS